MRVGRENSTPKIEAKSVSRSFGPVQANRDVSLRVYAGQILAVIGENGAGKSTLMKILYGLDKQDSGDILVDGEPVSFASPKEAIDRGIGLVQQELAIIPELTLLENFVLGHEPQHAGKIDWKRAKADAQELANRVGADVEWSSQATHVPIAIQQQVEILRLISRGANVLILDEPTAVLAPDQASQLLTLLTSLAKSGTAVIFISHKLGEVLTVADEIVVLRSGITEPAISREDASIELLTQLIMGDNSAEGEDDAGDNSIAPETNRDTVLLCERLSVKDDLGTLRLHEANLEIKSGEIVGIAAVSGNGQEELAECLIGLRQSAKGRVTVGKQDVTNRSVRHHRLAGLGYVSADRKLEGLALPLSISDNIIASAQLSYLSRLGWLMKKRIQAVSNTVLQGGRVRFGRTQDPISSLSGGNQQRVVIARELEHQPKALIASHPTRGVDIRGISFIHKQIRAARSEGSAVILFSEEIDELQKLSDRILVLHSGRIVGQVPPSTDRYELGRLMLGETK
jgi:ABC-type uncharacterized transport system ATPase subunit